MVVALEVGFKGGKVEWNGDLATERCERGMGVIGWRDAKIEGVMVVIKATKRTTCNNFN